MPEEIDRSTADFFTRYLRDITERDRALAEREWAESRLAGEKRLLEMVASGCVLSDVLAALCRFVETADADCHCGVCQIDWSGPSFRNGVAPSLAPSYTEAVDGLPVRHDVGPCAIAAFTRTQVLVEDVASDVRWSGSPYAAHLLAHGLRSVWSTPIFALKGHVLGTFCVFQRKPAHPTTRQQELIAQVTHIASIAIERSQAEEALRRSEALLAEGQRLSLTGTLSWRVATEDITWSDQLYHIFGVTPGTHLTLELIGSRIHPEDLPAFADMIGRAFSDGTDFEYEHRLLMPDNSIKHLHVVAHATRDHDGRVEYLGAVQDVTERRLADEALEKARSELAHVARATSLGTMTASIAHEVSQPLSGIITNASTCLRMLAADPPNVEGARETARRTIRDGNRASEVIARLRALFGKRTATTEPVDLNEASREVITLSLSELRRHRVVVHSELADDLPLVLGDRVQLQQVVLNLLMNAAEAMGEVHDRSREVALRTERAADDCVRMSVRDAGTGLDPRTVERLFDAFYTTKHAGMGIGLSISRSIIESHGGRLSAIPNDDGPGATFVFTIPRVGRRGTPDAERGIAYPLPVRDEANSMRLP